MMKPNPWRFIPCHTPSESRIKAESLRKEGYDAEITVIGNTFGVKYRDKVKRKWERKNIEKT